jgi:glyoxylase-like metal-dependent hydrolase (beta-lactamase superfamily II)
MKVIHMSYKSTNIFLVPAEDGWLMIDAGWPDTFPQILRLLKENDIAVNEINYLVITHFHPDHAGLTQNLKDLGTNLIVHECQLPYIKDLNVFYKKNPKANFKDIVLNNNIIVSTEESRDLLKKLGIDGEIVPTPGHTDDSISILIDDYCAFIGDLPAYSLAEAYADDTIEESWKLIQLYGVNTIYPGHGDSYTLS